VWWISTVSTLDWYGEPRNHFATSEERIVSIPQKFNHLFNKGRGASNFWRETGVSISNASVKWTPDAPKNERKVNFKYRLKRSGCGVLAKRMLCIASIHHAHAKASPAHSTSVRQSITLDAGQWTELPVDSVEAVGAEFAVDP
jgi:hypothetical protein